MTTLFSKDNLKNLHFKSLSTLIFMLFLSSSLFGQMGTLQVRTDITSGIITPIDSLHEIGLVQFQVTGLTEEMQSLILKEYLKYEGEIVNCGFDITDDKLIVSYKSPSYPNFLLAILDRINIKGFYEVNGTDTYYFKDGYSAFIR